MVRQDEIRRQLGEIRTHFEKNLNNKYVKNVILKLDMPTNAKHDMNIIMDSKALYLDSKGTIEDLYNSVKAITLFIKEVKSRVIPNIYSYVDGGFLNPGSNKDPNDKILSQMAVKNYPMNISILGRMLHDLLTMIMDYDESNFASSPAHRQVKGFDEMCLFLNEIVEEDFKDKNK